MILYESEFISPRLSEIIIEAKDNDGLTPLYLLCENGYRRKYYKCEDDWLVRNFLKQFGVIDQLKEFLDKSHNEEIFEDINLGGIGDFSKDIDYLTFLKYSY